MSRQKPQLSLVIPCFNEEAVLPESAARLARKLNDLKERGRISGDSAIYFVDDGSTDHTWNIVEDLAAGSCQIRGIKLTANRGHQNALLAGMLTAPGDIVVTMDADLQDDVDALDGMLGKYREGAEVVLGVRTSRNNDSAFKKHTAEGYYWLMNRLGVNLVSNHADYRLLTRTVLNALSEYREVNLFLRGLVPLLGFRAAVVEYSRGQRVAGETKYPLRKMLSFAWNGVTSFSNVPLRLITGLGIATSFLSISGLIWVFLTKYLLDDAIPGWASITLPLFFLGGVQLLSLGVIGEYVAKIYLETKARPRFTIEKQI